MTLDDYARRALYYQARAADFDIASSDRIVDLVMGSRNYDGYGWRGGEDSDGTPYEIWDQDMNDD